MRRTSIADNEEDRTHMPSLNNSSHKFIYLSCRVGDILDSRRNTIPEYSANTWASFSSYAILPPVAVSQQEKSTEESILIVPPD